MHDDELSKEWLAARCVAPEGGKTSEAWTAEGPGVVGWPGALQPPAPSDPGVTVSRHRALLTRFAGQRSLGPTFSGRRGRALVRAARSTIARTFGRTEAAAGTYSLPSASGRC